MTRRTPAPFTTDADARAAWDAADAQVRRLRATPDAPAYARAVLARRHAWDERVRLRAERQAADADAWAGMLRHGDTGGADPWEARAAAEAEAQAAGAYAFPHERTSWGEA